MSFAEYNQTAEDHASLLILIRQVGSCLSLKSFNKVFDRISRLRTLKVANPPRVLSVRYKRFYTIENNAWGNFQAHRKVLGLLSIGKCENKNDVVELRRDHEDLQEQYEGTILDSRLIVFGSCFRSESQEDESADVSDNLPDKNDNICDESTTKVKADSKGFTDPLNVNGSSNVNGDEEDHEDNQNDDDSSISSESGIGSELRSNNQEQKNRERSHILYFHSEDSCQELEEHLQEYLSYLFWVLEGKRLDRSQERQEHLTLFTAPFERKDSSSGDSDGRLYRRRCQGRLKKHLADLCLLSGVCGEAALHYRTAIEILRGANDLLWMAGAFEGLAAALYLDLQGRTVNAQSMARNPSFSFKPGLSRLKEAKLRPSLRIMTPSVRNGLDLADNSGSSSSATLPEDVLENYRAAIINYSKFSEAGVIEMEASLKACRILIAHHRTLDAADCLQNVASINLTLTEEERIQRFITLSNLYSSLNMPRKAAFYNRIAAMHCVFPSNPKQAWPQCYHLLIKSLPGFRLSLDPKEIPQGNPNGWSNIQLRVIHELVYSARRMGNVPVAIRHLSFLLHTMFDFLRNDECVELAGILKSYTNKSTGTHLSIALDDGTILPPVVLYRFPTVRSFRLLKLLPHCRPVHFKNDSQPSLAVPSASSPFIYSPLTIMSSKAEKESDPTQYYWVEGEPSEVEFQLCNPLPFELVVDGLGLMTEGKEVVFHPVDVTILPESGPVPVKLMLNPCQPGQLTIIGYTTQVFGVRSHCRLREIGGLSAGNYTTTVVPALPMLQVKTSLPKTESFCTMEDGECVVASGSLSVYAGQTSGFEVNLTNVGKIEVGRLDVILSSTIPQDLLKSLIVWDESGFEKQLPLLPGSQSLLSFSVNGLSNFLTPATSSCDSCAGSICFHRLTSDGLASLMEMRDSSGIVTVEILVLIQYGGVKGLSSCNTQQFCRQCSVSVTVDILPSLYITHWQIFPSLRSDDCVLELDVENCSSTDVLVLAQQTLLAGGQNARLHLNLPRIDSVPFSSLEISSADDLSQQDKELKMLQSHICRHVDVRWSMPSSEVVGRVSLEGLCPTRSQFSSLQTLPITWALVVDGKEFNSGSAVVQQVAKAPVDIAVTVVNRSASDLVDVCLRIIPCQDVEAPFANSKICDPHLCDAVIPIGCTRTAVAKVSAGASATHNCSFFFPWCGAYEILCVCEASTTDSDLSSTGKRQTWRRSVKMDLYNSFVTTV